jgi:hypothetical protein
MRTVQGVHEEVAERPEHAILTSWALRWLLSARSSCAKSQPFTESSQHEPATMQRSVESGRCYRADMPNVERSESSTGVLEPRVIWLGSRRVEVLAIIDRWYGTDRQWWKVETDEGVYVLRLDETNATWEVAAVVGQ